MAFFHYFYGWIVFYYIYIYFHSLLHSGFTNLRSHQQCVWEGSPFSKSSPVFIGFLLLFVLFVCFLGLHPWHMKIPRLGVKYSGLNHSHSNTRSELCLRQWWILNTLNRARDQTHFLVDIGWVHYHWTTMVTSYSIHFFVMAIVTYMRYATVVLICISLIISNAEHLLMCLWLAKSLLWKVSM